MDMSFSNEFVSSQERCFYSAPTSPSRVETTAISGFQTEPTTPRTNEDPISNQDEFEFETSRRFNLSDFDSDTVSQKDEIENQFDQQQQQQQRVQRQRGDSLPTMAFADELFCDGKVLPLVQPLKLKPPPRFQNGKNSNKISAPSSSASSPGSGLRLPFLRQSLWNDDFDPFTVALEMAKEEKSGKSKGIRCEIRRTRSLSPFRRKSPKRVSDPPGLDNVALLVHTQKLEPNPDEGKEAHSGRAQLRFEVPKEPLQRSRSPDGLSEPKGLVFARGDRLVGVEKNTPIEPNKNPDEGKDAYCGSAQLRCEVPKEPLKQRSRTPNGLSEPKGLMFARRVSLVGVDNNVPIEPNKNTVPKLAMGTRKVRSETGGAWTRKRKRDKIMKFLFGNGYMGKASSQHKLKDKKEALGKPVLLGRLGLEPKGSRQSTQWAKDGRVSEVNKMTLACHKPRLLLCLGYGGRYVK